MAFRLCRKCAQCRSPSSRVIALQTEHNLCNPVCSFKAVSKNKPIKREIPHQIIQEGDIYMND